MPAPHSSNMAWTHTDRSYPRGQSRAVEEEHSLPSRERDFFVGPINQNKINNINQLFFLQVFNYNSILEVTKTNRLILVQIEKLSCLLYTQKRIF